MVANELHLKIHAKWEINGQHIEQVLEVKYLSLILDSHLKCEKRVKMVSRVAKTQTKHTYI